MSVKYLTITKFSAESGYTEDAIRAKINRGIWLEGAVWFKAPDNRLLISIDGYNEWVESTMVSGQYQKTALRSTSGIKAFDAGRELSSSPPPLI